MIRSVIFIIVIPHILIGSALNNTFLLFLRTAERFREDYDIAVAMLAPPQLDMGMNSGFLMRLGLHIVGLCCLWLLRENSFGLRSVSTLNLRYLWLHFQGYHLHIPNLDVLGSFFDTTVRIFLRG